MSPKISRTAILDDLSPVEQVKNIIELFNIDKLHNINAGLLCLLVNYFS